MRSLSRFAWGVLAYHLAVVAWGAFVRASGSGAGCGSHWPLCNGAVIPPSPALKTVIELTHRATSGIALALVLGLAVWAVRACPRRHPARAAALASLAILVVEALLGAGLVLFGWVDQDASPARALVVAAHLVNTFLLLGALALTADLAEPGARLALRGRRPRASVIALALFATVVAGATGAVAALGDTLFPSTSFAEGLRQELSGGAHALLRLRVIHPFAALAAALALGAAVRVALRAPPDAAGGRPRGRGAAIAWLAVIQVALGAANVALLAPVPLQLAHLLLADLIWVLLVLLGADTLRADAPAARPAPALAGPPLADREG